MKKTNNSISDWLDKHGDPDIRKQVEVEAIELLIEDYERRLKTAETMLSEIKYSSIAQADRIRTKVSCYRTFINELKQQL